TGNWCKKAPAGGARGQSAFAGTFIQFFPAFIAALTGAVINQFLTVVATLTDAVVFFLLTLAAVIAGAGTTR
ncbi:TPA: hypothetical protein ACF21L_005061, partial [Escherichia coli]